MNLKEYKQIIKDTVGLDYPNYLKQKVINSIIKNKIGKYGTKECEGIVLLTGLTSQTEKIDTCLDKKNNTFKLIDLEEIKKGFKYSIVYQYKDLDFINFKKEIATVAINLEDDYYNYGENIETDEIQYLNTEDCFFIKFHKYITEIDKKNVVKKTLRYPIVFVFHKNINLFEVRFDRLAYNNDYEFHKITKDACLAKIVSIYKFNFQSFDMENTVREIVTNHKKFVKEIIWSFETAKSKGLTLRVGEDGIMPFLGELEVLIEDLRNKYSGDDVTICLDEIVSYMNKTKNFANEKFRILSWLQYFKNGNTIKADKTIDLKIIFNYNKNNYTLLNIYDNEINDMERINHVIRFIGKIARDIGEL